MSTCSSRASARVSSIRSRRSAKRGAPGAAATGSRPHVPPRPSHARRKSSLSKAPCHIVPQTEPTFQPSRKGCTASESASSSVPCASVGRRRGGSRTRCRPRDPTTSRPAARAPCSAWNSTAYGQVAQARHDAHPSLDVVDDLVREHLVATADAEHRPTGRHPASDGLGEAALAQPGEVGSRRTRVRAARPGRRTRPRRGSAVTRHVDARLGGQRVDVGGVGRRGNRTTATSRAGPRRCGRGGRDAPAADLRGCPRRRATRRCSQGRTPSTGTPVRSAIAVQPRLAAARASPRNLLITQAFDQAPGRRRRAAPRCRTARRTRRRGRCRRPRRPAAPNVAGQAHVDVVAGPQVDLGRASRRPRTTTTS